MLKALGMEHWMAKELACSRKGYWRMAQVLNQIFSKKIIARLGYTSMSDYYLTVYEISKNIFWNIFQTMVDTIE